MKLLNIGQKSILVIYLLLFNLLCRQLKSPDILSIQAMGMGGAFTAIANDEMSLFINPASIALSDRFLLKKDNYLYFSPTFLDLQPFLTKANRDYLSFKLEDKSIFLQTNELPNVKNFSFMLNFVEASFRYYPFEVILISFADINKISLNNRLTLQSYIDIITTTQIAFGWSPFNIRNITFTSNIIGNFYTGISLRLFHLTSSLGIVNEVFTFEKALSPLKTSKDYFLISQSGFGLGVDLGTIFEIVFEQASKYKHTLRFGLATLDVPSLLFTEEETEFLFPNIKIGIAYIFPNYLKFSKYTSNLFTNTTISSDFNRLIDLDYESFTKFHIGFSTNILDFEVFKTNIATGINKGYLTGSITMYGFNYYKIFYLLYQDELLTYTGLSPNIRHQIGFSFYYIL